MFREDCTRRDGAERVPSPLHNGRDLREKDSHDEIEGSTSVNSIERPNRCSNGPIWVDGTETCHHRRIKHEYDWKSIDFVKLSDTLPPKSFMEIPNDIGATFDAA